MKVCASAQSVINRVNSMGYNPGCLDNAGCQ
jgi:hypothetical protein